MAARLDWVNRLEVAIEQGLGDEFGLEPRHLERAVLIQSANTWVEFTIERHPHILGRQSVGEESAGYVPTQQTYRLDLGTGRLELLSEKYDEPEVDWDLLIEQQMLGYEFLLDDVQTEMAASADRANEAAWITCARRRFDALDWNAFSDMLHPGTTMAFRKRYFEKLFAALVEDLLESRYPKHQKNTDAE